MDLYKAKYSDKKFDRHSKPNKTYRNSRDDPPSRSYRNSRDDRPSRDRYSRDERRPEMHTVTCGDCGDECQIPFEPKFNRPVYCSECFQKNKPQESRDRYSRDDRPSRQNDSRPYKSKSEKFLKKSESFYSNGSEKFYSSLKEKLFEIFYENEEFREKIYKEIENDIEVDFQELSNKKTKLIKDLDNLLVETYQTSPVLIDDTRLITGEEGCLCTFDIEFIKNKTKEGLFDPRKMSESVKDDIVNRLDEFSKLLQI